ncbi:MAG TPA: VWA domain-containing protein, partial [bacterium]|nr:VWA domain-containing protein [bacterium]
MRGEKLAAAKRAALLAVDRLHDEDIVSVVTYESTVNVLVPATRASDRATIRAAIEGIRTAGKTALFAGVSKGAAELRKFMEEERISRAILLSDGLANVGPSSPELLGNLGAALAREGITVTTIGLGLDFNEDLMAQLAFRSDGNHFFVADAADLELAWDTEFGDVLSVVSQAVDIEIRFPDGVRPVRTLGRDARIDGQTLHASLNHVYAEQTKYLLLELEVPGGEADLEISVAGVTVEYVDAEGERHSARANARVRFTDSPDRVEQAVRQDVMVAVVRQIAAEQNQVATALRDAGRIEEARAAFLSNRGYLSRNAALYRSEALQRDARTQLDAADNLATPEAWNRARKLQLEYQVKTRNQGSYTEKKDD